MFSRVDDDDDGGAAAPAEAAPPKAAFVPVRNVEGVPNFVARSGNLFKKGSGSFGRMSRRSWKKRHFELVLDAEGEEDENVGPLLTYADPKKTHKVIGRELLDGCDVDSDTDGKDDGKPGRFRFSLIWDTEDHTSERQLYATTADDRAEWVAAGAGGGPDVGPLETAPLSVVFPLVSAHSGTSDHLSGRSRSVDVGF